jgi:hypothetical protein|tara:strand:+ start:1027 stop:1218 length:192 start_codon:yes stop_codon:yes gene_type:complete
MTSTYENELVSASLEARETYGPGETGVRIALPEEYDFLHITLANGQTIIVDQTGFKYEGIPTS